MRRGVRAGGLVAAGVTAALLTVGPVGLGPARAAEEDRTLRVGTTEEFDSLNPNLAFIGSSAEASLLDYDVLVGFGPDHEYAPTGFAESWTLDGVR